MVEIGRKMKMDHYLDSKILRCVRCGWHETGLSARLRIFDHPDAPKGWEVKHCDKCGGRTVPIDFELDSAGNEPGCPIGHGATEQEAIDNLIEMNSIRITVQT